ncbi:cytochrome P450 2G1-like [Cebus imitator]|uniref:cytochrome P450 2G1-like n=1 Tax=Cebus imitator TaxID=2715852 RepID=UPI000809C887|nr:cytochrome P450 2G1-like [Cebus imitator]
MWQPVETRDFIDCFLDQMAKQQQDPGGDVVPRGSRFSSWRDPEWEAVVWGWLEGPKVRSSQPPLAPQKGALELDTVARRPRTPSQDDHVHLPYTNRVLLEIQRFISVVPPRALIRDTYLRDHFLPQGTFDSPACDYAPGPTQFKNPDCFNPTNFLDDKGKFQGNDAFMPSGARRGRGPAWTGSGVHGDHYAPVYPGKQRYLGTGLAHSEIFLFLTAILHRFCLLPVVNPSSNNLACSALA